MLARGRRPAISKGNRLSVQNQRQLQHSVGGLYSAPTVVECFDNICVNLEEFAARFEKLECTEEDYEEELECIEKVFSPWVEKCKQFCYILFL